MPCADDTEKIKTVVNASPRHASSAAKPRSDAAGAPAAVALAEEEREAIELEEAAEYAAMLGERLGFYISSLNMPDDVKIALLEIIEDAELEQKIELHDVLEAKYLRQCLGFTDRASQAELKKLEAWEKKKKGQVLKEATKKINALADQLQTQTLKTQLAA